MEWSQRIQDHFNLQNKIAEPFQDNRYAELQNRLVEVQSELLRTKHRFEDFQRDIGSKLDTICAALQFNSDCMKTLSSVTKGIKRSISSTSGRNVRSRPEESDTAAAASTQPPPTLNSRAQTPMRTPRSTSSITPADLQADADLLQGDNDDDLSFDDEDGYEYDEHDEEEPSSTASPREAMSTISPGSITVFKNLPNLLFTDALDIWFSKKLSFTATANWIALDIHGKRCNKNKNKVTKVLKFTIDSMTAEEKAILKSNTATAAQRAETIEAIQLRVVKILEDFKIHQRQSIQSTRKWEPSFNQTITAMSGILTQMSKSGYDVPHSQVSRQTPTPRRTPSFAETILTPVVQYITGVR
jgi:hypothetical protein